MNDIQEIYFMNYKLKSQQSIQSEKQPDTIEPKNFRYNEQYYNIQNNRIMQLTPLEIRQKAVDGGANMEVYSEDSAEKVTRKMNFHFQKKISADKEGLKIHNPKNDENMNMEINDLELNVKEEKRGETFKDTMGNIYDRVEKTIENIELSESGYATEHSQPEKLIYHHNQQSNKDFKTDVLGKFFMDKNGEQSQTNPITPKSKDMI